MSSQPKQSGIERNLRLLSGAAVAFFAALVAGLVLVQQSLVASQRTLSDPTYLAFSEPGYRVSIWLEKLLPESRYVHIIGDWVRLG